MDTKGEIAASFLDEVLNSRSVRLIWVDPQLFHRAVRRFKSGGSRGWSFTVRVTVIDRFGQSATSTTAFTVRETSTGTSALDIVEGNWPVETVIVAAVALTVLSVTLARRRRRASKQAPVSAS